MRHFSAIFLSFLFAFMIDHAFADMCCPRGCIQDYNPNRCVSADVNRNACGAPFACSGAAASSQGGSKGTPVAVPILLPGGYCVSLNPMPAQRDAAADTCIQQLSANAQLLACLFEDDAGRAEDRRTGLSCPQRQAALAGQCRNRCLTFARWRSNCIDANVTWQQAFGDIGGTAVGSARVDLCGPRLKTSVVSRELRAARRRITP